MTGEESYSREKRRAVIPVKAGAKLGTAEHAVAGCAGRNFKMADVQQMRVIFEHFAQVGSLRYVYYPDALQLKAVFKHLRGARRVRHINVSDSF